VNNFDRSTDPKWFLHPPQVAVRMAKKRTPPPTYEIDHLTLPRPVLHQLSNGIPVYEISMGTQEALKLEIVFFAGRPQETVQLASRATAALLKEGTLHRTGAEIAEAVDFFGGTLSVPANLDTVTVTLYCLRKYFHKLLPIVADILTEPVFPERELTSFVTRNQQRLQVDLQRNDVVAYRTITEQLYGTDHPYGYNSLPETYGRLTRNDLLQHFERNYRSGNCKIFLSGSTDQSMIDLLDAHLGMRIPRGQSNPLDMQVSVEEASRLFVPHPDTLQAAIRIGRRLFDRTHSDFPGWYVLNTLIGGYFGSRLMANIREEKGYTYNIYSSIDTMVHDGYFSIATEVGNDFVKPAIAEIYRELEVLQQEPVGDQELHMMRNYLMGTFLTMVDGPFSVAEVVRTLIVEGDQLDSFEQIVQVIRTIEPETLMQLAKDYLQPNELSEVVVGNPDLEG
jgi:zinc protease